VSGVQRPIRTALVLGGASDIALATVRRLCRDGLRSVVLATRDDPGLRDRLAADPLPMPDGGVHVVHWDALETASADGLRDAAASHLGDIDLVLCAVGSLGHHSGLSMPPADADLLIRTNFAGPAAALLVVGRALAGQGHGTIVVLSSVAGARARRSNFVYGSAKAGLDAFAQGLGDALVDAGVGVLVVRPGFVTSKMTTGLDPAPLASTPEAVAEAVAAALARGRHRPTWVPPLLGPAFGILRNVPAPVWRRIAGNR
jgi:decaprenylphospho-beta-D-erythro-pentofuranosid-2-ulose 2-reductase